MYIRAIPLNVIPAVRTSVYATNSQRSVTPVKREELPNGTCECARSTDRIELEGIEVEFPGRRTAPNLPMKFLAREKSAKEKRTPITLSYPTAGNFIGIFRKLPSRLEKVIGRDGEPLLGSDRSLERDEARSFVREISKTDRSTRNREIVLKIVPRCTLRCG